MNYFKHPIFSPYLRIADGIYSVFGNSCEVVVHDLQTVSSSLIYIKGNVTGRKIGAPATDVVLQEIKKKPEEIQDLLGIRTNTAQGIPIKTSTIFIRDEHNNVVGLLGINLNLTAFTAMQNFISNILTYEVEDVTDESYASTVEEVFQQIVQSTIVELSLDLQSMTRKEKVNFVQRIDNKGLFLIQGSMDQIAELLQVSKQSIYNYLEER